MGAGHSLCHKPPAQRIFAFDAFRFTKTSRDALASVLVGETGVPFTKIRAEGVSFDLASAIGVNGGTVDEIDEEDVVADAEEPGSGKAQKIYTRTSSLETVLGHWIPSVYVADIEARLKQQEQRRERRLEEICTAIASDAGRARARAALTDHVQRMEEVLREHRIDVPPIRDRDETFERFLQRRAMTLSGAEARARLSKVLTITAMPDIWMDNVATSTFVASAFADLAYRLELHGKSGGGQRAPRSSRIVRSFQEALGLEAGMTDDEIRNLLEAEIKERGWSDEAWMQ